MAKKVWCYFQTFDVKHKRIDGQNGIIVLTNTMFALASCMTYSLDYVNDRTYLAINHSAELTCDVLICTTTDLQHQLSTSVSLSWEVFQHWD